jgi:hypothetical protein
MKIKTITQYIPRASRGHTPIAVRAELFRRLLARREPTRWQRFVAWMKQIHREEMEEMEE